MPTCDRERLGRYEVLAELGRGAMGTVYQARDPKIDRLVAIKTISVPNSAPPGSSDYRERFFREARAAGRLSHPGIVTIYDVDEDPERSLATSVLRPRRKASVPESARKRTPLR